MAGYKPNVFSIFPFWAAGVWFLTRLLGHGTEYLVAFPGILTGSCLCFVVLFVCYKTLSRRYQSTFKDLPGPKTVNWLYDHAFDIFDEPLAYNVTKWINDQVYPEGLMHFFGVFGSEYIIPTDHEGLLDVLSNHSYDFEKTTAFRRYTMRFFGDGLVTQEQDAHKKNRKLFLPVFNQTAISQVRSMVTTKSRQFVNRISELCRNDGGITPGIDTKVRSAIVPFTELVAMVSLDIVSNLALGIDFKTIEGRNRHVFDAFETIFASTHHKRSQFIWHNLMPPWIAKLLPSAEEANMDKAHDLLDNFIREAVPERSFQHEHEGVAQRDFLTSLVQSGKFDENEHVAQVVHILAAGFESTGGSLDFVIYCLAAYQDAQRAVRNEVVEAKNGRETLNEDEYDRLPVLNAMVTESLRLYPSFPLLLRKAIRDTTIKGRFIPRGTYIGICPRAINYAKHLWGPEADKFNLERWIDRSDPSNPKASASGGAAAPVCMLSFGYGTRSCVGRNLALVQIKRQIALIVERFHVEKVDDRIPHPTGLFASTPPLDLRLRFIEIQAYSSLGH